LFERAVYLFVLVLSVAGTIWLLSDSPYDQTRTLAYLASGVLFGWWAIRGLRREAASRDENEVFARAEQLEKTDPAAADQLLDSFFMKKGELAAQERAKLWTIASQDRGAAARLERLLKDDLRGHELMRRQWIPTVPAEERSAAVEMVDKRERQTREELERVLVIRKELKA
jgi:hypothetical protein